MRKRAILTTAGLAILAVPFLLAQQAIGSDHADTREVVAQPGSDLSDVFMFPSPENPNNVVLVMNVNPLIARGGTASFDPNVLYQFKIDRTGDAVEDLVIQAKFTGTGAGQTVQISGPIKPTTTGNMNKFEAPLATTGQFGKVFTPAAGMRVFCGVREDPFFFDLEQFFTILPDRGVPAGLTTPPANANQPMAGTWRSAGTAVDFLSNGGFNVLSIVVELPKSEISK